MTSAGSFTNKERRDKQSSNYRKKQKSSNPLIPLEANAHSQLKDIMNCCGGHKITGKTLKEETGIELTDLFKIKNTGRGYDHQVTAIQNFLEKHND